MEANMNKLIRQYISTLKENDGEFVSLKKHFKYRNGSGQMFTAPTTPSNSNYALKDLIRNLTVYKKREMKFR